MTKIGEEFKKIRMKKGLDYKDVFKKIKIHPHVVQALEEERFDYFSSSLYARSFLHKYAEFLGIKKKELLKNYDKKINELFQEKKIESVIYSPKWLPQKEKIILFFKIAIYSIFAIFMIFLVFVTTKKLTNTIFSKKHVKVSKKELKSNKVLSKHQKISTPIILEIYAKDDSWMELKADGETVFEGILKKDSQEKWQAKKEFEIWVGKADVLQVTINGSSYGTLGKGIIKGIKINSEGIKFP
jgi:cytoskeletal protein RodZ